MNDQTTQFVEELKKRPDVLGVILFGSWARGNQRPDSDVDLVVILSEGYQRAVEKRHGQIFEVIYTTEQSAYEYWEDHRDDAAGVWSIAKILLDKEGIVERLRVKTQTMLIRGKKPITPEQLGQLRFDAEDQVKYTRAIADHDLATAEMILNNKVFVLIELFFDLHQLWIPAPKQRLDEVSKIQPALHEELKGFYTTLNFEDKSSIAQNIVRLIFDEYD